MVYHLLECLTIFITYISIAFMKDIPIEYSCERIKGTESIHLYFNVSKVVNISSSLKYSIRICSPNYDNGYCASPWKTSEEKSCTSSSDHSMLCKLPYTSHLSVRSLFKFVISNNSKDYVTTPTANSPMYRNCKCINFNFGWDMKVKVLENKNVELQVSCNNPKDFAQVSLFMYYGLKRFRLYPTVPFLLSDIHPCKKYIVKTVITSNYCDIGNKFGEKKLEFTLPSVPPKFIHLTMCRYEASGRVNIEVSHAPTKGLHVSYYLYDGNNMIKTGNLTEKLVRYNIGAGYKTLFVNTNSCMPCLCQNSSITCTVHGIKKYPTDKQSRRTFMVAMIVTIILVFVYLLVKYLFLTHKLVKLHRKNDLISPARGLESSINQPVTFDGNDMYDHINNEKHLYEDINALAETLRAEDGNGNHTEMQCM